MTGRTHSKFSITFAFLALIILVRHEQAVLNYYISLVIMLLCSPIGADFPDWDRGYKQLGTKNLITWLISGLIHLTGGRHRSRHTHSLDICIVSYVIISLIWSANLINVKEVDLVVVATMINGFYAGWLSHLFADALTSDGIYIFFWCKKRVGFVPKKLNGFVVVVVGLLGIIGGALLFTINQKYLAVGAWAVSVASFIIAVVAGGLRFNTGGDWENAVGKIVTKVNYVIGTAVIVFPLVAEIFNRR